MIPCLCVVVIVDKVTCKMCRKCFEAVLVDALDLLTISVEVTTSLEEGSALVEDRVG